MLSGENLKLTRPGEGEILTPLVLSQQSGVRTRIDERSMKLERRIDPRVLSVVQIWWPWITIFPVK